MFRKCTSADHETVIEFLIDEKAMNLFIISDIENFGYEVDFQDIYAQFDQHGDIEGILLHYQNTYIPYAKTAIDLTNFVKMLKSDPNLLMVSGKEEIIQRIHDIYSFKQVKKTFFAELSTHLHLPEINHDYPVKKATINDADNILDLQKQIKEFNITDFTKQSYKRSLETKTGRSFFIEDQQGNVISLASTTAENTYSGMVVGVCSHPSHRKEGLASLVMTELCKELLSEGKSLCLFYDNLAAGRIYKRLGFEDIGMWSMAYPK